ncbi:MAG: PEP/pyruvate-binding domain-containing protein [Anaerolineae bacterium]|nr:PEP/pyruvate-binding domain-containing protein [Anaerolineae bacterium]
MQIYWLDSPACRDPIIVGGKAANLGRLAGQHPVPPGFCVSTQTGKENAIENDPYQGLASAYTFLGQRCGTALPRVAVRSSAIDEDGQRASFAGLHDTFLNIVGAEAVMHAVDRCIASAKTERAQHYRRSQGLAENAAMAVLVQQLVVADVSAVVFSADPCTGRRDRIVINATWGLGESLVGGSVTPDLYVVRKHDLHILHRAPGDKARMTVADSDGTREVAVPGCMRKELSLSDVQIRKLARLAQTLEQSEGWPVDLECAFQGAQLYLLQCRPITTLPD